jgi:DNA-binding response OmpR family regulator
MLTASGTVEDRVERPDASAPTTTCPSRSRWPSWSPASAPSPAGPAPAQPPVLTAGDIRLDPHRREATRAGRDVALTNKELGVLEVLMAANGGVVSAEDLLDRVWDAHADPFTNTVRVTLTNLRRKLGDPPVIDTVIGTGYRLST